MKPLLLVAFVALAAAMPASAQTYGFDGHRKVGQNVWVWKTQRIPKLSGSSVMYQVIVLCPKGYGAVAGGYRNRSLYAVTQVFNNAPTTALDGWEVDVSGNTVKGTNLIVYASCAPL